MRLLVSEIVKEKLIVRRVSREMEKGNRENHVRIEGKGGTDDPSFDKMCPTEFTVMTSSNRTSLG